MKTEKVRVRMGRAGRTLAVLTAFGLMIPGFAAAENAGQTVVEPTCTEAGYIVIEDDKTSSISIENLPATGHSYTDWVIDSDAGIRTRVCDVCGYSENVRNSTVSEEKLPKLYLTGSLDGIGKKIRVALEAEFVSPEESFECYAIMTLQGHSTYGYPKRNYTVRFYDDAQGDQKHKVRLKDWNREHKYILKACYTDTTLSRNLVAARLWTDITASRARIPERIEMLPRLGAVDGFPVAVYLNGEYFGLYTMNLHKDDDLYGMEDGERAALAICNAETSDEALFRAEAAFPADYSGDWEIEYCGTEDEAWARDSFNALVRFIMDSSDDRFRNELEDYLDVDGALDYLIFIYAMGLQNSGAKDLVMLNFGDEWIPSAYDMDEAFGLVANEARCLQADAFVPEWNGEAWSSGTDSLLWDRLINLFEPEIRERYAALRKGVLSEANIIRQLDEFIGEIPEAYCDMDLNLYADRNVPEGDMYLQIRNYIPERLKVLDKILGVDEK